LKGISLDQKDAKESIEYDLSDKSQSIPYTPETRYAMYKEQERLKEEKNKPRDLSDPLKPKKAPRVFEKDGKILQMNEGKWNFNLINNEDTPDTILELELSKFLDTSLIDVDVQPNYIKLCIKGKYLQLRLDEEVNPFDSSVQRSLTSGNLMIRMPKVNFVKKSREYKFENDKENKASVTPVCVKKPPKVEFIKKKKDLGDFVDDLSVPPLE
jgi:protein TilB